MFITFFFFRYGYGYPSYYSPVDDDNEDDNTRSYGDWDEEYEDYVEIDEDYDVSVSYDHFTYILNVQNSFKIYFVMLYNILQHIKYFISAKL